VPIDTTKVGVALSGAISKAPLGATAPTDSTTVLAAAFVDSGAISADGVTLAMPGAGDVTPVKAWQGGLTVRTLRTTSDDLPSLNFVFLETNKTAVETYFETTVTQTVATGSFTYNSTIPTAKAYVLDVIDGAETARYYAPRGVRAEVGDLVFKNDEPIGYEVTLELEFDAGITGNFKSWNTRLKS